MRHGASVGGMTGVALSLVLGVTAPAFAEQEQPGRQLYLRYCGTCHGPQGKGDGVASSFLRPSPPDLTQLAIRHAGQFPADDVRRTVDGRESPGPHGSRQMPVWGVALYYTDTKNPRQEQEVQQIVDRVVEYLRSIQKE